VTETAKLMSGRGSPFIQRGGAIRRQEPEEGRARLGGAVERTKLLRGIENVDFSRGHHLRNAIEFVGRTKTKSAQNCAHERLSRRTAHALQWAESIDLFDDFMVSAVGIEPTTL
jgi:hypothetical protein